MRTLAFFFCLFLSLSLSFAFSNAPDYGTNDCDPISGLTQVAQTSNSITYAWDGSADAEVYRVWYVRQGDLYTSPAYNTTNTSFTFSNLAPGNYTFFFEASCSESQAIIIQDLEAI
jgi:hypothetical protein